MKKFLSGLIAGVVLALSLSFGLQFISAESPNKSDYGNLTEQQSKDMELEWYRSHHDTLSKALSGKCE